jgi:ubiquinol-cytochrome c reductase cytochrome c subunit
MSYLAFIASQTATPISSPIPSVHTSKPSVTGPQSMPVFSDKTITPEEKLSIIKWIKAAESEPQLGGAALGRVGPVTEGLLVWTLGIGLLIGVAVWLAMKAR